jgi:gamma-glutamylcyclotransferase (GGCT)/AIG2-like uncharacterized protein YtfP
VAVFVYGTLLDPAVFARFAGRRPLRRALPARLMGYRRVRLRGTPYPTLVEGAGAVAGLLLPRLAPDAFRRLAAYEGPDYALRPVRVSTPRGPRWARAWVAASRRADPSIPWNGGGFATLTREKVSDRACSGRLNAETCRRLSAGGC